jgi:hypothetical protein
MHVLFLLGDARKDAVTEVGCEECRWNVVLCLGRTTAVSARLGRSGELFLCSSGAVRVDPTYGLRMESSVKLPAALIRHALNGSFRSKLASSLHLIDEASPIMQLAFRLSILPHFDYGNRRTTNVASWRLMADGG